MHLFLIFNKYPFSESVYLAIPSNLIEKESFNPYSILRLVYLFFTNGDIFPDKNTETISSFTGS